jgi:hypothetical protein
VGAVGGAALKLLVAPARFERALVAVYLLLGWAGLAALGPLLAALPPWDLVLLAAGGLLYSLGVVVHLSTRLPYHNALWHALVLAAASHFAVVLRLPLRRMADGRVVWRRGPSAPPGSLPTRVVKATITFSPCPSGSRARSLHARLSPHGG